MLQVVSVALLHPVLEGVWNSTDALLTRATGHQSRLDDRFEHDGAVLLSAHLLAIDQVRASFDGLVAVESVVHVREHLEPDFMRHRAAVSVVGTILHEGEALLNHIHIRHSRASPRMHDEVLKALRGNQAFGVVGALDLLQRLVSLPLLVLRSVDGLYQFLHRVFRRKLDLESEDGIFVGDSHPELDLVSLVLKHPRVAFSHDAEDLVDLLGNASFSELKSLVLKSEVFKVLLELTPIEQMVQVLDRLNWRLVRILEHDEVRPLLVVGGSRHIDVDRDLESLRDSILPVLDSSHGRSFLKRMRHGNVQSVRDLVGAISNYHLRHLLPLSDDTSNANSRHGDPISHRTSPQVVDAFVDGLESTLRLSISGEHRSD